eukprot:9577798-Alexandrium_andersonii.AAC.1
MLPRSAQQSYEGTLTTVQTVGEIGATRLEPSMLPAIEPEEEGFAAGEAPEPAEQRARTLQRKRRLERPGTPPRQEAAGRPVEVVKSRT